MIEHLGSRLRHRYMIVAGLFLAGSILGISLFVSGSLGSVQSAYALNHGVGLTKGCDDTTPEIGDTVGCNAQTVFIDQALDSSVILGAIDCILAPNQAGSPFASLNVNTLQLECLNSGNNPTPTAILPTSIEVVTGTNAICTQSNSQNVLPCLMGDALKTTASNGLTLPGANLPGSIIFHYTSGFTYTIPGTYRDQAGISWKDLGDGIPGQGADTINTQQTPSPTVNSVVPPKDYTPSTLSSVTGSVVIGSPSLVNPTDTLSIAGVNGVSGTFAISNAALTGPGGPYAATATPNPVGPTSTFPATTTLSLAPNTTISQVGTYCWDVTVTETGGNYVSTPKVLTGSASPGTECFTVTPENYTPSTQSSVTGSVVIGSPSLVNPTDTLSIAGVNGVSGTFAISNAALTGPGGPYAATATPNPVGPTSTFPATTTLSLAAGTTISQAGTYCWDVTVTETGGNYVATPKVLTGSASPGTECFTVEVQQGSRTPGYWKTHLDETQYVMTLPDWDPINCAQANNDPAPFNANTIERVMGGFYAGKPTETDGSKRAPIDHARMQLTFQLQAAKLNYAVFGSTPDSFGVSLADA